MVRDETSVAGTLEGGWARRNCRRRVYLPPLPCRVGTPVPVWRWRVHLTGRPCTLHSNPAASTFLHVGVNCAQADTSTQDSSGGAPPPAQTPPSSGSDDRDTDSLLSSDESEDDERPLLGQVWRAGLVHLQ